MKYLLPFFIIAVSSLSCYSQQEKYPILQKGEVHVALKLPHLNFLSLQPGAQFKDQQWGFNGYGLGGIYVYHDKRFLEAATSIVLTTKLPFPTPIDRAYNKSIYSYYISLTDNLMLHRISLGYGLNYSSNHWVEWTRDLEAFGLPTTSRESFTTKVLGITMNAYYSLGKTFGMGIIYRPTLYRIDKEISFTPEHLISLELNWKIRLFGGQN